MEKSKAPSQWKNDPRARCLTNAQREGMNALPELRKRIRQACLTPPAKDQAAPYPDGQKPGVALQAAVRSAIPGTRLPNAQVSASGG